LAFGNKAGLQSVLRKHTSDGNSTVREMMIEALAGLEKLLVPHLIVGVWDTLLDYESRSKSKF